MTDTDTCILAQFCEDAMVCVASGTADCDASIDIDRAQGGRRTTLRISAEAVAAWRASGPGWQLRLGAAMRDAMSGTPRPPAMG